MKKFIFAAMAALAVIASSCYEDKGNYDYHDVDPIDSIKLHWKSGSTSNLVIGDTARIIMRVVFKNPNENINDWKFVWRLNNQDVAEGLEFEYVATKLGTDYYQFYAEHKSGQRYYQGFPTDVYTWSGGYSSITVKSPYTSGWLVLGTKNGNVTTIDYFRRDRKIEYFTNEEGEEDGYYKHTYSEFKDIYKERTGEEIGTDPICMHEYFASTDSNVPAEILIMQGKDIASDNSFFIDGREFNKVTMLKNEFVGDVYPAGTRVQDFVWGCSANFAILTNGKLHVVVMGLNGMSGTNVNMYSHILDFLSEPYEAPAGSHFKKFMGKDNWIYSTSSVVAYDSGLNTYRFFYSSPSSGNYNHGREIVTIKLTGADGSTLNAAEYFPSANVLGDYEVIDWYHMAGASTSGEYKVMAIKKHKTTGAYVYDYFTYSAGSYSSATIKILEENVALPNFNDNTKFHTNKVNEYMWYANGKEIRFYDPAAKKDWKYTTTETDVKTLYVGPGGDYYQEQQLVVATADKKLTMYNIGFDVLQEATQSGDAMNYGDRGFMQGYEDRVVYWQTTTTGDAMQIHFRTGYYSSKVFDQF